MTRMFAVVALIAGLGVLFKLAWKAERPPRSRPSAAPGAVVEPQLAPEATISEEAALLAKYPDPEARELVARTLDRFQHNAIRIEATDGLRGLALLDRLDLEAIFLYENHPREFQKLRESLDDESAARILSNWREYFGYKRTDDVDRGILINEVGRLPLAARRIAADYPNALPLVLTDPVGMTQFVQEWDGTKDELVEALALLSFVSLETGASDLHAALRVLEDHGPLALDAFRLRGMEGFGLVSLYGQLLTQLGDSLPLNEALTVLYVNSDDVDQLSRTRQPEELARHIRHVAALNLTRAVGGSPHGLRLVVEFGAAGERALREAGPDAADVVYESYADPNLRTQAVASLADHGGMALLLLDKYAADPDFRDVLRQYGSAAIPPIARADVAPEALMALENKADRTWLESVAKGILTVSKENGQGTIRQIKSEGLGRVAGLQSTDVKFYQFLPMYDVLHLAGVLGQGYRPTGGEMAWATIDGCFVIADVLSLLALQPQATAASEAARTQVKVAAREAVETLGEEVAERVAKPLGKSVGREVAQRAAKWWAVRKAGGTYELLRRLPEAMGKLAPAEIANMGRAICAKAGIRLSTFAPVRFVVQGKELIRRFPAERGLKYVVLQCTQASVGILGVQKMEEHLRSRRPATREDNPS